MTTATTQRKRDIWGSKREFLLACIGYAVGLSNIWRFPYLCFRSGGGAFLIPYFIMIVLCVTPLLYMEMAMGQLTRSGPIRAIAMLCPILKGVGVAMIALNFFLATYYSVIIAWALHYLINSFKSPLPWMSCDNSWSNKLCSSDIENSTNIPNGTEEEASLFSTPPKESASNQYLYNYVLQISSGVGDFGGLNGELVGCLLLSWVLCYLCVFKGVHSAGKVVHVTALFPYIILLILLVRAVTLPGAIDGLRYLFVPAWRQLFDPNVWFLAAAQIFGSLGVSLGSFIAFSSYNDTRNNIYHDTLAIVIANAFTSLLAGTVVFSSLGVVAHKLNVEIPDAVAAGPDLVFVAIPPLFADLPGSNVWAILFFLMLVFLGIDSLFGQVEVINTSIIDHFGDRLEKIPRRKAFVSLCVCIVCFVCGLPHVTKAGMYILTLVDNYGVSVPVLIIAYFEAIAICYIYGGNRLAREITFSSGKRTSFFFPFSWIFVTPFVITVIAGVSIFNMKPVQYGDYIYPIWAHLFGLFIAILCLIWIPLGMLHELYKNGQGKSGLRSFMKSATPTFISRRVNQRQHTRPESPQEHRKEVDSDANSDQILLTQSEIPRQEGYSHSKQSDTSESPV